MYRRLPLIILSLGVLLGRTALADKLTLTNGGQLTGTLESVTFRHGATDTVHAGGSVASLDLRTTAGDELLLTGGTKITGALISLRFKTIGGVLPFERAKIAAVTIPTSLPRRPRSRPATRPAARASAKYDDRVKLTYGCEVRGMLMTAKMRVGKGTRTNLRGLIEGIDLADDADSLLRPGRKNLEGRLIEVRFKTSLGTVSFARDEVVSFKLARASRSKSQRPTASKTTSKPTPRQARLLEADERLYKEHLRKVAEAEKRRLADLDKRHAETQKEIDELVAKAKAEVIKWKHEVAKDKKKDRAVDIWNGGPRLKRRTSSGSTVGLGSKQSSPQQQRLDAAKAAVARLVRQKTVVTRQMEDARGDIRRSVIAAQKRLKATRLKHRIIVLAGGTLTEAQMTSHYRADVGHGKTS